MTTVGINGGGGAIEWLNDSENLITCTGDEWKESVIGAA